MRLRGRTDANQEAIVRDLRKAGALVLVMSSLGNGAADLLVHRAGKLWLFEIKDPRQKPSGQALTDDERVFHALWPVHVIRTTEEALKVISQ